MRSPVLAAAAAVLALLAAVPADAQPLRPLSVYNWSDYIGETTLADFKAKTGIDVRVISQGTGQALDTGRRGDADVVFVHARSQEVKFVEDGFGIERKPVMYNDFVLIGPKSDPAGVKGSKDIAKALQTIQQKQSAFVSRGDRSGTHAAELALWKTASVDDAFT
jgi:tungstate transport system substrate-binding protein